MLELPVRDPMFQGVFKVVDVLRTAGHDAWIVGGAVRDLLMGQAPPDYDVATSARPEQVMGLFRKTVPVGVQFGVVRVRLLGGEFEVATLRADIGYTDGRRPDAVRFTDLREDVLRRDFTINGLVLDPVTGEVIDLVGGRRDLEAGVVRAIGDADARFSEDWLRPLRAIRFAARTGFVIESATYDAIVRHAAAVAEVSVERIADEMRKLLTGPRPGTGIRLMADTGLLGTLLPELPGDATRATAADALDSLAGMGESERWSLGWALLLWPMGEGGARDVMSRLRHSRKMTTEVASIVSIGLQLGQTDSRDVVAVKRLLRREQASRAIVALATLRAAEGLDAGPAAWARAMLGGWSRDDLHPRRLVTGNDAIAAGVSRGPGVSRALVLIEDAQLCGVVTTRDQALQMLRTLGSM